MVTKSHITVQEKYIADELRRLGRCVVRLPNTAIEFEISHRGVEVVADGTRYMMLRDRDICYDRVEFYVKIHNRWECRATQESFDGLRHFEVIDKAGDPFEHSMECLLKAPSNDKRKKVLLCV